jgi:hypothetical protein
MLKKPNQNQSVYLAAVIQSIAVGQFVWMGTPALDKINALVDLPNSINTFVIALLFYGILTLIGYWVLDTN